MLKTSTTDCPSRMEKLFVQMTARWRIGPRYKQIRVVQSIPKKKENAMSRNFPSCRVEKGHGGPHAGCPTRPLHGCGIAFGVAVNQFAS
jgi:hypothetical protein